MTAEPLHVRVSHCLGWTDLQNLGPRLHGGAPWHRPGDDLWVGIAPCVECGDDGICDEHDAQGPSYQAVPPYGEESPHGWAVTGPFLRYVEEASADALYQGVTLWHGSEFDVQGETWGETLCHLVLALGEAGRLDSAGAVRS